MANGHLAAPPTGTPASGDLPLALYADFERKRGGLLHVLQGLLVPAQLLILSRVPLGQWWSPAALMPLYLAYFAVRGPVWRRFYRQRGHLESEKELQESRSALWWGPLMAIFLSVLHRPSSASEAYWLGAVLWIVVMWAALLLWGKLTADWWQFMNTALLNAIALRPTASPARLVPWTCAIAAAWVIFGVTQHLGFVRTMARHGGKPHA
jgi:hypothetical protein